MSNTVHLSKLSRGYVELSEDGSHLEVFADRSERPMVHSSGNHQYPHVSKTFSTKRGPLLLFTETNIQRHSRSKTHRDKLADHSFNASSLISPPPLKIGELKRSILAYGASPENQFADGIVDEDGTFVYMRIPAKKRSLPSKYAGINPNVAIKRRHLLGSGEDRRRELESILDTDNSLSRNQRYSMMKTHVLSDEISLIPPIYRNPELASHTPTDAYRFFKIDHDLILPDTSNPDQSILESAERLQIVDGKGSVLDYDKLEPSEKEKVLADLLVQTALENIAIQPNIENFEDALNRVRESELTKSISSMDLHPVTEESSPQLIRLDANGDEQSVAKPLEASTELVPPLYMFGKMQGSKWARQRPLPSNALPTTSKQSSVEPEKRERDRETEQDQPDGLTQTTSDVVHSKLFRLSRLLAPISISSYQDSSTARSQTNAKISNKARKLLDIESNPHRVIMKGRRHPRLNSSPMELQHDPSTHGLTKLEREKSRDLINRQRSSKSLKQQLSRQGTGKTFATDRCVTSPLSIREETDRLLGLETPRMGLDDLPFIATSTQPTLVDGPVGRLIQNTPHSDQSKMDEEQVYEQPPLTEVDVVEDPPVVVPEPVTRRSAYTHRSHGTGKSKNSSIIPPGALLIAPDGEILTVGGPQLHTEGEFEDPFGAHDIFGHQPLSASMILDNHDPLTTPTAPYVPMVLGTKRERLPDETVIRRTLNLTGGAFNSQIGLQSFSYEMPLERRRIAPPESYPPIPPAPPMGLSAFTGRKYHMSRRSKQEVHEPIPPLSTLSIHTDMLPPSHSVSRSPQKLRSTESPLFGVTTWAYQRPRTPPTVKKPYLYRPDYRPSGVHGHKHPPGETETMIRRTIDVHAGDIDASLSFTIWVYDMWISDLVRNGADPNYIKEVKSLFDLFKQRRLTKVDLQDKDFLTALAHHAQALAKIILRRSDSGFHLAEDAQLAIIENLRRLKYLLDQRLASVSDDVYLEVLRDTLQHVLTKGNLQHLQVTDDVLMSLMDYPLDAFEIYFDPETGEETIRIKSAYRTKKSKIKGKKNKRKTKTVIISEEISADDFYRVFDPATNEAVYRFHEEVAEQKGFSDLLEVNFDIVPDKMTRERFVQIKSIPPNASFQIEIFLDHDSGKQILVLRKEIPKTPPMIQSDISIDDFEFVTDETTGETVLRLKPEVAARKGLYNLLNVNFEVVIDPDTGQQMIQMKGNPASHGRIEIFIDPLTGKQMIRMATDVDDDNEEDVADPIVTVTESAIDLGDFERVIDPSTGREVLRMRADVLKAKGLEELANVDFEIVIDNVTGQSRIIMKTPSSEISTGTNTNFEIVVDFITGRQKIIKRTVTGREDARMDVVESQLTANDFERVIDPETGEEVLRLKKGAAARKGLTDLVDVQFEMVTGADGKQTIAVKGGANQGNSGGAQFELVTDASGRTTIKVKKERPPTPDMEVTEKPINISDFEEVIDPKTGAKILKLKSDVAKRAGMTDLLNAQFESYIDPTTGKQAIRVKQGNDNEVKFEIVTDKAGNQVLRMVQEIPKTVEVTSSDVNANDFEEVTDAKTGKKILRMKKEVAKRKGFVDMDNVDFEVVIDQKTGQQTIQIKNPGKANKGPVTFEMVVDPLTGQQTLRMKQEVDMTFETLEDELVVDDFEEVIDEVTGERIFKLTAAAAARKGLTDMRDVAFEVYTDPNTGKEQIRMKDGDQTGKFAGGQRMELFFDAKTGQQKFILKRPKARTPPPVEKSIDINDFEKVIDEKTGKEFYRFTEAAARRKGLTQVQDMEFEVEVDAKTGKTIMKPKVSSINGQSVEVIVDPTTGEQTIRLIRQKSPDVPKMATIKTTIDLDKNAFTVRVDPTTGKKVIQLSQDLVENYGLENIEFEKVVDETTGEEVYRMKPVVGKDGKVYELVTDPTTGKQSLQIKETVSQQQFKEIVKNRENRGLQIPRANSGQKKTDGYNEERDAFDPFALNRPRKKNSVILSPDGLPSPLDRSENTSRTATRAPAGKGQPMRVKSPSGQEYEIEWTSDDEKELDGLTVYDQRRRKEQMLAEKRRKVAEMKRQEEFALQQRLRKQREELAETSSQSPTLLNAEERERAAQWERDLRKLDAEREGMTDEEYQARRKKLLTERQRVMKLAYDRKMDRLKRQNALTSSGPDPNELEEELESQIRAEEEMLLSMMNPEEREEYIRARNEERARQRLIAERDRLKREEELQAALAETKRMASIRAAEIMAKELQMRSANAMYAELRDLITEQKISRAFTYSYFSLLQFLSPSSSAGTS